MKIKTYLLTTTLMLFVLASFGQTEATLYKSGQWLDSKGKGGWAKAYKDPTYEKVEILHTDKNFKVIFGSKTYTYKIVSSSRYSDVQMRYNVTLNGKSYEIQVSEQSPGTYSIGIDSEWMVYPITNVSTINTK